MAERVLNAVPTNIVERIPAKLREFNPGMNISQVHDLLGLKPEYKFLSRGGGPFSYYHQIYHLRQGYNLVVYVDMTKEFPYPVHKVELAGDKWKHLREEGKEEKPNQEMQPTN